MATTLDLRATINDILEEYGEEAREAIVEASKATAKSVVKDLRKAGTFNGGEEFRKGWTYSTDETRMGAQTTVYNKTKPGLAHLLEYGHALRTGGRSRAFNFIAPISETVEDRFLDEFSKRMG